MRSSIEGKVTVPNWTSNHEDLKRLHLLDRWLEGTIYDDLKYDFHKDMQHKMYITMENRKPSVRWRLPKQCATQIARKMFAGRHKPVFVSEKKDCIKKLEKLVKEGQLHQQMLQAAIYGSVGSVLVTFKILPDFRKKQKLVVNVHKAKDCFPSFDVHRELTQVRIAYLVKGSWFLDQEYKVDAKGEELKPESDYWFVKDLTRQKEVHYQPYKETQWNPFNKDPEFALEEFKEGNLKPFEHGLGFVPGHWFINLAGGDFPYGACTWENALDNVVEYDYTLSQIGLGIKNSACPHVVFQGAPIQAKDGSGSDIPWSPTRFIQFPTARNDQEGIKEETGDAHLLEPTGQGMLVGIQHYARQVKKDALEMISMSRKDPDKMTTSMSGRGMELVEEEFMDLVMDLRTNYGDYGYLALMQKIGEAAIQKKHKAVSGLKVEDLEDLDLAWPKMHDMSPQEYQQFMNALFQGVQGEIIDTTLAGDIHRAQVDIPIFSDSETKVKTAKTVPVSQQAVTPKPAIASKPNKKETK